MKTFIFFFMTHIVARDVDTRTTMTIYVKDTEQNEIIIYRVINRKVITLYRNESKSLTHPVTIVERRA